MIRCLLFFILLMSALQSAFADSEWGASLAYPLIGKDPARMTGYRGSLWYQPPCFVWKQTSVYFDASIAHWYITNNSLPNRTINILAVAPVFRLYFTKNNYFSPYVEASVGPAYQSKVRFDDRNLGMHFAFQDQVLLGALFGKDQRWSASVAAMHYSNGSLSAHNAGITIPLLIKLAYGFI